MPTILAFIRRRSALTYFVLTFAIAWGGILILVGPSGIPGASAEVDAQWPLVMLMWFAGPSLAGLLMTGLAYGRAGFGELLSRLRKWRVDVRWYAVALLTVPLLVTAALSVLLLASPEFRPGLLVSGNKVALLVMGIVWGLVGGGLLEELGWTGFAVLTLRRRYGIFATGIIVGLLWGALHILVTLWMSGDASGALSLAVFLPAMLFYAASLPAYRVLMVWVYERTGRSLLVAMLMHASFSATRLILNPPALALAAGLTYELVLAAALWGIVAAVAVANHGRLSRRPLGRQIV